MPASSSIDPSSGAGTPNRRRRSGSRGRARVSITTTTINEAAAGPDPDPGAVAAAVLTSPASSSAPDIRQVRTGDTTVLTGAHTRGATSGGSGGGSGSGGMSASPGGDQVAVGPASPSYQSMGAGTQATATATATAGGLLYSALGTIKDWTSDLANDLLAVDGSAHHGDDEADRSRSTASSGGRYAEQNGPGRIVNNSTADNNNNNDNNSNKNNKTSSSPGRKLRAAVRSLSPGGGGGSGRRGTAATKKNSSQRPPILVTGTNPCGPAIGQVMEDLVVQATTAMDNGAGDNDDDDAADTATTSTTTKPVSRMRQKLVKSSKSKSRSAARSAGGTGTRTRKAAAEESPAGRGSNTNEDGVVGGGDSTVVARTNNPSRNDKGEKDKSKKEDGPKTAAAATTGTATTGTETTKKNRPTQNTTTTTSSKPQTIGPVQFLQHMMSTNCMATTGLAQLGFGGESDDDDDDDDDDDGSSYDESSSEDGSDDYSYSDRRRQRQQPTSRRRAQRRSGSGWHSGGGSRGQRGGRRRGSSTLSGRPEDIPEGDEEDEDSAALTAADAEEDLDVIGRRPGVGVVRDKGGTPRKRSGKSGPASSDAAAANLRHFSKQLIDQGFPLIWHRVHDSKLQMEPTDITAFIMLDEESPDPCLTWDIYDDAKGRSKKVTARGSIPLFDIASVEKAEAKHLQAYPFAMPGHSFFVTLSNGGVILFEAKDRSQQQVFVRGLRWVVARLSFNLIVGNGNICTELGLIDRDALEEDIDCTMDDVTNRLVDVSVQAVLANSMMKA